MIIAIDGPSGTGKSTIAKKVAAKLNFSYFDTGAMYRSLAWWLDDQKIDCASREEVAKRLDEFHYEIGLDAEGEKRYFVHGVDVTKKIRDPKISTLASEIAVYAEVRTKLVEIQRNFGAKSNAVFEGRDMGSVVFPNAELKIFLTAKPEVRAKRRLHELLHKFPNLSDSLKFDQILKEIKERDKNDETREISPLKQAADAILVDTSYLSIDQVVEKILSLAGKSNRYESMKFSYRLVYSMAKLFFTLFFRLQVYGKKNYLSGPAILASNHTSHFDPPVLSISCPEEVHFLAKDSLFKIPLFGKLIRNLNAHPVSGNTSDAAIFREIIQLLQSGKKVILFPEGTRSSNGDLQPLERGMAFIAYKAKCPIIPVYIDGPYKAWPIWKKFPKLWGKIRLVFGTPIDLDWETIDRKEAEKIITEKTIESFKHMKVWLDKVKEENK